MKFSKAVVILVVLLNSLFAVTVLWLFYTFQQEPIALIAAWFAFTTGELWALSRIKRQEIEEKEKHYTNYKGFKKDYGDRI